MMQKCDVVLMLVFLKVILIQSNFNLVSSAPVIVADRFSVPNNSLGVNDEPKLHNEKRTKRSPKISLLLSVNDNVSKPRKNFYDLNSSISFEESQGTYKTNNNLKEHYVGQKMIKHLIEEGKLERKCNCHQVFQKMSSMNKKYSTILKILKNWEANGKHPGHVAKTNHLENNDDLSHHIPNKYDDDEQSNKTESDESDSSLEDKMEIVPLPLFNKFEKKATNKSVDLNDRFQTTDNLNNRKTTKGSKNNVLTMNEVKLHEKNNEKFNNQTKASNHNSVKTTKQFNNRKKIKNSQLKQNPSQNENSNILKIPRQQIYNDDIKITQESSKYPQIISGSHLTQAQNSNAAMDVPSCHCDIFRTSREYIDTLTKPNSEK